MYIKYLSIISTIMLTSVVSACHTGEGHQHDNTETANDKEAAHVHGDDEIVFTPEQAQAAGVVVEEVKPADFREVIRVTGSILPAQGSEATVSSTITGLLHLSNNSLTEGCEIKAGQSLFNISTQKTGDGNPGAAAKAELENASQAWERAKELIKDKIISQREYEAVRQRYETAKSTAMSFGNGKSVQTITAPIKGFLQNLLVKNGDFVTAGQPLATITQNRNLQLRGEVPERYYASLGDIVSANFRLNYDAATIYELDKLDGHLISSGHTVNQGEGFLPITFEFNNQGNIIPGSLAEIYLLGRTRNNVISVPISALTEELGLYFVYLQTSDHGYEKREVKKGANNGKRVEITEGLHRGEKLVVEGAIAIKLAANSSVVPDAHAGHNH